MVPREHVPPTVYGPTPADPDELEREANELVADIQRMSMTDIEADLPSPLVVMFWLNEQNQMRPIACATEDKREDSVKRAAQCYNYSTHDYVPFSALESVTRERDARITELERLYETEQRHSAALMARINELTKEMGDD